MSIANPAFAVNKELLKDLNEKRKVIQDLTKQEQSIKKITVNKAEVAMDEGSSATVEVEYDESKVSLETIKESIDDINKYYVNIADLKNGQKYWVFRP